MAETTEEICTDSEVTMNAENNDEPVHVNGRLSVLAWVFVVIIRIYQFTLSPFIGNQCRHLPTCSRYGEQAIRKHGAIKGGWLTFKRILRCNPWGTSGHDPVP